LPSFNNPKRCCQAIFKVFAKIKNGCLKMGYFKAILKLFVRFIILRVFLRVFLRAGRLLMDVMTK
jgi:hypothetical protein